MISKIWHLHALCYMQLFSASASCAAAGRHPSVCHHIIMIIITIIKRIIIPSLMIYHDGVHVIIIATRFCTFICWCTVTSCVPEQHLRYIVCHIMAIRNPHMCQRNT